MQALMEKLRILAVAARYDASCASSGSSRQAGGVGNTSVGGICHSWSADGRCISLLKVLFSNRCRYDCAYCINRCSNDVPRATFTVREVVELTMNFYRRNYIEGLFLSSGVCGGPDDTTERMVRAAEILRQQCEFGGYIHLKIIPGSSLELVTRAGRVADRLSVNIELPSRESLARLAPHKRVEDIVTPMHAISRHWEAAREERRKDRRAPAFSPAGQSTQLIVGASPENDFDILRLSENLYDRYALKRVYYSAYVPVNADGRLPMPGAPPLRREHRLYQADWLLRLYGYRSTELLDAQAPFLDPRLDPKAQWALRHPEFFPVDVQWATREELLRVPGLGLQSAQRILATRRVAPIRESDLKRMGVVLKRARWFLSIGGRGLASPRTPRHLVVSALSTDSGNDEQPWLFPELAS